jgi:hypothetical protein
LFLLGLLAAVWAHSGDGRPTEPVTAPAAISFSTAPCANAGPNPLAGTKIITRADQGQTLHFAVGDTFTVRLEGDTGWEIQITDPRVVVASDHTATFSQDEQRVYRARTAGVTELVTVALPFCAKDHPPCRVMAPAFRVLIVVR